MKLTTILVALALTCGTAAADPKYPATSVFMAQWDIIDKMNRQFPDVEVDIRWMPCGMENSFYVPALKTIVLCTEFERFPQTAVYIAAHEMAHAIQHQLTDVSSEQDADELAALSLVRHGYTTALMCAAMYWRLEPNQGRTGEEHPANGFRAWELACIADGSTKDGTAECRALYDGLVVRWDHRLRTEFTTE